MDSEMDYKPTQTTPFSIREKILARAWRLVWLFAYRPTPWFFYKYRVWLLNLFGASVAASAKPANSAFIEYPWRLSMDRYSSLGERSWVYCLNSIKIGEYSCIGQGCQLITGSHNYRSAGFEMVTAPIAIGSNCWLSCDVTVLMGVNIGDCAVVGIRSLVTTDVQPNSVSFGCPAKRYGERFV